MTLPYQNICEILQAGGIVALPTDTVFGLALDPKNRFAMQKIYRLKRRDAQKPLVYMVADPSQLTGLVSGITPEIQQIISKYWPGALTIVFRAKDGRGTIGARIPNNKFMLELLKTWGKPLAVTSANLSGEPELNSAQEIRNKFSGAIDLYIEAEEKFSQKASTVIDVSGAKIKVLRQGEIKI